MANWNDDLDILDLEDLLREEEDMPTERASRRHPVREEDDFPAEYPEREYAYSEAELEEEYDLSERERTQSGHRGRTASSGSRQETSAASPSGRTDRNVSPDGSRESSARSSADRTGRLTPSGARRARRPEGDDYETSALPLEFMDLEDIPEDLAQERAMSAGGPEADDFFAETARSRGRSSARAGQSSRGRSGGNVSSSRSTRTAPGDDRDGNPQGRRTARSAGNQRSSGRENHRERRSASGGIPIHLILPVIIVIVAAIAVVRFAIWNAGVDLDIDSEANANRYNVEVNDSMAAVSSSDLEGAVDDGITTVLCLGNEPFSADTSETGLAAQIAALGDCEVLNAAFPDSQVTCENATYTTDTLDDMDDIFNLFYVAYAIAIDDYTSLETVASVHDETWQNAVEVLETTDFSTVDIIAIMYDGIDYVNGMAMYNEEVPEELTTYVGSLYNSIILLREAYPHIRIVFLSPYYAEYETGSARTTDLGNGTIVDYYQWAYDTCGSNGISFLDNYYGSINENNYEDYLNSDMTLNADGATKIADHFVYKVIQGNYAEYNVEELAVAQ